MSIHIAIPVDRNVIKKAAEKILKYKLLVMEIHGTWNVRAKLIPVVVGGDWNHFKITRTLPEQHTGRVRI